MQQTGTFQASKKMETKTKGELALEKLRLKNHKVEEKAKNRARNRIYACKWHQIKYNGKIKKFKKQELIRPMNCTEKDPQMLKTNDFAMHYFLHFLEEGYFNHVIPEEHRRCDEHCYSGSTLIEIAFHYAQHEDHDLLAKELAKKLRKNNQEDMAFFDQFFRKKNASYEFDSKFFKNFVQNILILIFNIIFLFQ